MLQYTGVRNENVNIMFAFVQAEQRWQVCRKALELYENSIFAENVAGKCWKIRELHYTFPRRTLFLNLNKLRLVAGKIFHAKIDVDFGTNQLVRI